MTQAVEERRDAVTSLPLHSRKMTGGSLKDMGLPETNVSGTRLSAAVRADACSRAPLCEATRARQGQRGPRRR